MLTLKSCETRCKAVHLDCSNSCPCGASCPDGCNGMDDFCSANEFCSYTDLAVFNDKQAYQNKALLINTLNDHAEPIFFEYNFVGTASRLQMKE